MTNIFALANIQSPYSMLYIGHTTQKLIFSLYINFGQTFTIAQLVLLHTACLLYLSVYYLGEKRVPAIDVTPFYAFAIASSTISPVTSFAILQVR